MVILFNIFEQISVQGSPYIQALVHFVAFFLYSESLHWRLHREHTLLPANIQFLN